MGIMPINLPLLKQNTSVKQCLPPLANKGYTRCLSHPP